MTYHRLEAVKGWYQAHERHVSTASLMFGFVFDSLTLQRIDALRENLWVTLNLLIVAICIVLLNRQEAEGGRSVGQARLHFWLLTFLQFGFGALLGTFFIFYFRSSTLAAAWPFLLALLGAMVANELVQKRYARLVTQLSFFYLSIFAFAIFLVPVALKRIGSHIFLLSGLVSLLVVWLYTLVLNRFIGERFRQNKAILLRSIASIFIIINILYFTNIIPPVPLSLKDARVYHGITKVSGANYLAQEEKKSFLEFFRIYERVHRVPGAPLYVYSAVFSPASLNTRIVHEWQYKHASTGKWVTASKIPLSVSGGRGSGFRTYSTKSSLAPGLWRVNVSTPRGQIIGRISFRIIDVPTQPELTEVLKD